MSPQTTDATSDAALATAPPRPPSRPRWVLPAAVLAAAVVGLGLWLTQPWLLFVDVVAEESLPVSISDTRDGTGSSEATAGPSTAGDAGLADDMGQAAGLPDGAPQPGVGEDGGSSPAAAAPSETDGLGDDDAASTGEASDAGTTDGPVVLATGTFISRDHGTSGTVAVVRLEDGSRVLTIEDLDTDNGPDLFVYLDDTPADGPEGEFDDGISLGQLRANQGDLVYEIPDDVDLGAVVSVGIWCDRFSSLFGAADLAPVG